MVKVMDLSKFKKGITKSIPGISTGFNDPKTWIDTGSYLLNYMVSGDWYKGIPLEGKMTTFAGESGSAKSYIVSGNMIKNAQDQGIFVLLIDTENALDEDWLKKLNVDTSEDKLLKVNLAKIDDMGQLVTEFIEDYRSNYSEVPLEQRPKVMIVIDSYGMLLSKNEVAQAAKGDMKGDLGSKQKALRSFARIALASIATENIGIMGTNHTYKSQDMFNPDDTISGGEGIIYSSSIIVALNKLKLKEDENGEKSSTVNGIRAKCCVRKTRYTKPFQIGEIKIPYFSGMDKYSGVFDFMEQNNIFTKVGNRYKYVSPVDNTEYIEFRKNYTNEMLDKAMKEFHHFVKFTQDEIDKANVDDAKENLVDTLVEE